jgi:putative aldouronate transport system substrate-binding protein
MYSRKRVVGLLNLVLVAVLVAGCPAIPEPFKPEPVVEELVEITWHSVPITATDIDRVSEAASLYLQERGINARLRLIPYSWAEFEEKVPLMLTVGEPCDLVFTAHWTPNNFHEMSAQGAYLSLDDLLPEHAPELWALLTPEQWNAGRGIPGGVGPITGVPNMAGWGPGSSIAVLEDILEKYPFEAMDRSWDDGTFIIPLEEWEPYMEMVMENEPELWAFLSDMFPENVQQNFGYDPVANGTQVESVRFDDYEERRVINIVETPEFLEYVQLVRRWVEKNLLYEQPLTVEDLITMHAAGHFAGRSEYWNPGEEGFSKWYTAGRPIRGRYTYKQYLVQGRATAHLTAVCASSPNPEVAVQILNLANTDPDFYHLISNGIEGEHWVWVDKDLKLYGFPEGVDATTVRYQHQDWTLGNALLRYYRDRHLAEVQAHDWMRRINEESPPAATFGFVFDRTKVRGQVAECSAVWAEYGVPLIHGRVPDVEAGVAELQSQLQACGVESIIQEMQRQIDEWAAGL